jgi:hypothetical protein
MKKLFDMVTFLQYIDKFLEQICTMKILVEKHERRLRILEERLSQYKIPVDSVFVTTS